MRKIWIFHDFEIFTTCKSFSEALIPASVDPQYDNRLFIEFPEKFKVTTCRNMSQHVTIFVFVLTFKTIYLHNMF